MSSNIGKKIAVVHDWLLGIGGAEKVLKAFHEMFPNAPIFVLFHNPKFTSKFLPAAEIRSTFLQKYFKFLNFKILIPLIPLAVESIDLSEFDLVISTAQFSKGLVLKPKTLHINYCSSPTRQVWDWNSEYRRESRMLKSWLHLFQHFARIWDRHASLRVDHFMANSQNTANRIRKYYNRAARVIYPPVLTRASYDSSVSMNIRNYFLIVSRLYRHKNVHLAVRAFQKLEWPLIIIGDGPEMRKLKKLVAGNPWIYFLGYQPTNIVHQYYMNCQAFVAPQEEDFGMTAIEAMSFGKPVLALKRGGALEYIKPGINGEFFEDPYEEMLADGARRLKQNLDLYNSAEIKKTVERFTIERFQNEVAQFLVSLSEL